MDLLLEAVTSGVVSLLTKPVKAPETKAVIAKVYEPETGFEDVPSETANKLEEDEYIELKLHLKIQDYFLIHFLKS